MSWLAVAGVSLLSGLLGALGMGAGTLLMVYLRLAAGLDQLAAQGVNLLFFLPTGGLALAAHARGGLVDWRSAGLCLAAGLPAAAAGVWLGRLAGGAWLSKGFALVLLAAGVREFCQKEPQNPAPGPPNSPGAGPE